MKRLSVLAAVVLVVLMVHAWGGSAINVSPLASCEPDCTGVADGSQVADPYNCTNFYFCQSGQLYGPFSCGGNEFNPDEGSCSSPYGCEPECGGGANCPLTCNGTVDAIGDAFDCTIYYICLPSGASAPVKCPSGTPYYDGNALSCSADDSVCCSGFCTPYCTGANILVPDPNSCTGYYLCLAEGDVNEDLRNECDPGMVFNVQNGECVAGNAEPCQTLCDGAGGGNGGGSSPGSGGSTPGSGASSTPGSSGDTTIPGSGGSTDSNGCVSSLECTAAGNFAACNTCQPYYYTCSGAGASGVLERCPDGYVFNPLPANPICILESHCPYP